MSGGAEGAGEGGVSDGREGGAIGRGVAMRVGCSTPLLPGARGTTVGDGVFRGSTIVMTTGCLGAGCGRGNSDSRINSQATPA